MSFSPPSDWVEEESSGRFWKVLLGAGAGCLALVLVGAVLMTFGTCTLTKGCCESIEDGFKARLLPIQVLVDRLDAGEVEEAYMGLGAGFRSSQSLEVFKAFINDEGAFLAGGKPEFVGTRRARAAGSQYIIVQIKDTQTRTIKGVATFLMSKTNGVSKRGDSVYVIDEILVGMPNMKIESGAVLAVLQRLVDQLRRGDFEAAHRNFSAASAMDRRTFETFVESQGDLLVGGRVKIIELRGERPSVQVHARIVSPKGETKGEAVFDMVLDRGAWQIAGIQTMVGSGADIAPADEVEQLPGASDAGRRDGR